jgi:hypothetical protein
VWRGQQFLDERWLDDGFPGRDQSEGIGERVDVGDAVLEQVPHGAEVAFEQFQRVLDLDVLREDERRGLRLRQSDLLGGDESFVRVRGRHADVDDSDIWLEHGHLRE